MRAYMKPNKRICPLCKKEAEDEKHLFALFTLLHYYITYIIYKNYLP